MSLSST